MKRYVLLVLILIPAFAAAAFWSFYNNMPSSDTYQKGIMVRQDFLSDGLYTNTAQSIIPLEDVLSGGPKKDGIPALKNPKYITLAQADWLKDDSRGVLVRVGESAYFYPYDVLYWHEIVNDTIEGKALAVTFCPLCGSAIVYDRQIDNDVYTFGVSGKLWQSNLLMYDTKTESLWSQIEGQAMVGDMFGTDLSLFPSDIVFFSEIKAHHPDAAILSKQTGYKRPYGSNPYGTYESDEALIFPVNSSDESFHPKTLFVAGRYNGVNFALHREPLLQVGEARFNIGDESLVARVQDDSTIRLLSSDGNIVATYITMWFSWANHHRDAQAIIWSKNKE